MGERIQQVFEEVKAVTPGRGRDTLDLMAKVKKIFFLKKEVKAVTPGRGRDTLDLMAQVKKQFF